MASESTESPIKVDVGLKAGLEIKGEIPKESMGRALDALIDIIRPITEPLGLRADNIRLQRAEIAYKIAKIALETADLEQLRLKPPPAKFLVPFLEKASLEDKDEELHTRWAALLLSGTTHYEAMHLTFLDILTRLSSAEIKLLEDICVASSIFPELYYPGGHIAENAEKVRQLANSFNFGGAAQLPKEIRQMFEERLAQMPLLYGHVMYAGARYQTQAAAMLYTKYGWEPDRKSLEILERERLISIEKTTTEVTPIGWFNATFLGVQFVRDCSPRGRKQAKAHAERTKANTVQARPVSPEMHKAFLKTVRDKGGSV